MKIDSAERVASAAVTMEGAKGCRVRWLVDESQGAPNFAMRQFEVEPGGYTPRHSHPYEHEVFVLEGNGTVLSGEKEQPLKAGDFVLVLPDEVHQFRNTGAGALKFLCMVPNASSKLPVTMAAECAVVAPNQ